MLRIARPLYLRSPLALTVRVVVIIAGRAKLRHLMPWRGSWIFWVRTEQWTGHQAGLCVCWKLVPPSPFSQPCPRKWQDSPNFLYVRLPNHQGGPFKRFPAPFGCPCDLAVTLRVLGETWRQKLGPSSSHKQRSPWDCSQASQDLTSASAGSSEICFGK